jgi:hypothetical protein
MAIDPVTGRELGDDPPQAAPELPSGFQRHVAFDGMVRSVEPSEQPVEAPAPAEATHPPDDTPQDDVEPASEPPESSDDVSGGPEPEPSAKPKRGRKPKAKVQAADQESADTQRRARKAKVVVPKAPKVKAEKPKREPKAKVPKAPKVKVPKAPKVKAEKLPKPKREPKAKILKLKREPKVKVPKVPKPKREPKIRVDDDQAVKRRRYRTGSVPMDGIIEMGVDTEGERFDIKANPPCRKDTNRWKQFSKFLPGSTVADVMAKGIQSGYIAKLVRRDWVRVRLRDGSYYSPPARVTDADFDLETHPVRTIDPNNPTPAASEPASSPVEGHGDEDEAA